jgi:L-alanine-DL-glutamate epimerase-like enolase superfamily enzyme
VKIKEIRALGLHGATPEGGWSAELRAEDCVHTLIEVITDDGLTGIGSVYTSAALVEAALQGRCCGPSTRRRLPSSPSV